MRLSSPFHRLIKSLPPERREKVIAEIAPLASPGFDFFLLVILSCSIATLGLITNSPAVIIGAMLVAPLMSPIIAIGLASITGNARLLKNAISALLRGALTAVLLSMLVTLTNSYLPFISLQSLPVEVIARTRPTPIDLVIALAGGLAAAYAMTQPHLSAALPGVAIATALMPPLCTIGIGLALQRWDVAAGALLLFITNAVTIAFAAVLVFFLRGFGISAREPRLPRSLLFSAGLTLLLFVPLNYFGVRFFQDAAENRLLNEVMQKEVHRIGGAEIVEVQVDRNKNGLDINLVVRTSEKLRYEQVVALQQSIVKNLERPVALKVSQIFAEQLDPLIPPTRTPTPTPTYTFTPGPSPTVTNTATSTTTATDVPPTPTQAPTSTATVQPSSTPTLTATPATANVVRTALPAMQIYQTPGGPVIGRLLPGQVVTQLYRTQLVDGLLWVEIQDSEGRVGWVPALYLRALTPTITVNPTTMAEK